MICLFAKGSINAPSTRGSRQETTDRPFILTRQLKQRPVLQE
jgi:hypothetical protein